MFGDGVVGDGLSFFANVTNKFYLLRDLWKKQTRKSRQRG